jgi:hypothetical protein
VTLAGRSLQSMNIARAGSVSGDRTPVYLYAAGSNGIAVNVFDGFKNGVSPRLRTIEGSSILEDDDAQMATDKWGNLYVAQAFVNNSGNGAVAVYSSRGKTLLRTIPIDDATPWDIAVDAKTTSMFWLGDRFPI